MTTVLTETASSVRLSADQINQYARRGWCAAPGFFSAAQVARISAWTDEIAARPEEPGVQMVYSEPSLANPGVRLIQRIENFCPFHDGFDRLVHGRLRAAVETLLAEPAVMFKDKINFKMAGGAGFEPHQDQQAGWSRYAPLYVTALVTVDPATTIADGIAVRRAGDLTLPVVERYVDEIVTVDEDEIASAILMLLEREKTLAEGAGATALAALLQHKTSLQGAHTAVLVCGGNIDVTLLSRIIERGLVQDGRLIRLRIVLLDKPGALHDLTRLIASHQANIVDTLHNRAYYGVNLGDTVIDITMETRGRQHVAELLAALTAEGYTYSRVL